MKDMDDVTACMICDGSIDVETEEEAVEAWQHLIDSGLVWQLQGFYGRTARDLIENGICSEAVQ